MLNEAGGGCVCECGKATARSKYEPVTAFPRQPRSRRARRSTTSAIRKSRSSTTAIRKGWADHELVPSKAATDGEWCRRVYLDLIGRMPTVEELEAYVCRSQARQAGAAGRSAAGRRVRRRVRARTGRRSGPTSSSAARAGRSGGRSSIATACSSISREALQYNKPYDELAKELITATGSCQPGDEDFNGAANFLADKMEEGGVQATAKTSQIFLGMAVQCTQCHNHPFNEYKQNQFWELNAFFRQTRRRARAGGRRPAGRLRPRGGPRFPRRGRRRRRRPRFITSCATAR